LEREIGKKNGFNTIEKTKPVTKDSRKNTITRSDSLQSLDRSREKKTNQKSSVLYSSQNIKSFLNCNANANKEDEDRFSVIKEYLTIVVE
jgi:hypothetical protein